MAQTPATAAQADEAQLDPRLVLDEMKKNGVTHVVWLPDSETNFLYQLMEADPSLTLVPVSREGLAFSIAAGLATGGQHPIILIQNTGLMESGDSLRGWTIALGGASGALLFKERERFDTLAPAHSSSCWIRSRISIFLR